MRAVETQIDIAAPAQTIWDVLVDFESYGKEGWNAYIRSIEAPLTKGERISADTYTEEMGPRALRAKMLAVAFPELSWEVKLPIPGLIHARHYFRIEALSAGQSRLIQGEEVVGILKSTVFHLVEKSRSGFEIFNAAVKKRAEDRVAAA